MAKKPSFFERLTGTIRMDESEDIFVDAETSVIEDIEEEKEGELTVDVYQTNDHIYIKSMLAGVRPDDIDVSISRDAVTIRGKREEERSIRREDYVHQELYWGSFSRTIALPAEVEADEHEAIERHGLLTIKLKKLDKYRQTKARVKSV